MEFTAPTAGLVVETSLTLVAPTCGAPPCESIQVSVQHKTSSKKISRKKNRPVDAIGERRLLLAQMECRPRRSKVVDVGESLVVARCRRDGRWSRLQETEVGVEAVVGGRSRRRGRLPSDVNGSRFVLALVDGGIFLALPGEVPGILSVPAATPPGTRRLAIAVDVATLPRHGPIAAQGFCCLPSVCLGPKPAWKWV